MRLFIVVVLIFISCNDRAATAADQLDSLKKQQATEDYVEKRMKELAEGVVAKDIKTLDSCPLKLEVESVSSGTITLNITNNTNKTIDGIKTGYYLYNNFDEPVEEGIAGNLEGGISQRIHKPRKKESYSWSISSLSATKAKAFIRQIHFTDGSSWNHEDYKQE